MYFLLIVRKTQHRKILTFYIRNSGSVNNCSQSHFLQAILREKYPNTEFFLVLIFPYSDQINLRIWTLFTQCNTWQGSRVCYEELWNIFTISLVTVWIVSVEITVTMNTEYRVKRSTSTVQKIKFSIKDFFSKCDQIRSFLRIR